MPSLTINNFKALIERYHFSDFLPYESYDHNEQIYKLNDGVGFVMEARPMGSTGIDTWNQLKGVFEIDYPTNSSVSFMMVASPYINWMLSRWAGFRQGALEPGERRQGGIFRKLARYRYGFVKKGINQSMYPGLEGRFRDFRLIISVKVPSGSPDRGQSQEDVKTSIQHLTKIRSSIIQQFKAMNLHAEMMPVDNLCQLISSLVNPKHEEWKNIKYNPNEEMRKQLIFSDNKIQITENFLEVDKMPIALQTVKQYPTEVPLWEMTNLLGDMISNNRQIPVPFVSVMHAHFPEQDSEKKKLQLRGARAIFQGIGKLAQYIPKLLMKAKNYEIVLKGLDMGGQVVRVYHQILLYGRNEEETAKGLQAAKALYQAKGFILQSDQYISAPLFINALPLGFMSHMQKDINRSHTMTSLSAAHLVPLESDFAGTKTPTLLFFSRRGQPMLYDLFDNEGNYNAVIAAASGAGKSFFTNEIAVSYLATGGKIRIIDVGRSYKNTAEVLNGQFVEFSEKSQISLNPFSKIKSIEGSDELQILIPLIGQMASPGKKLGDWEKSTLERIIIQVFRQFGNRTTIDSIADALQAEFDQRAKDLGIQLFSYTSQGRRGKFFMGENNVDLSNPFIVLELEELKSDPDLQSVVLLLVLYNIAQEIYQGNGMARTIVIIDEAWSLLPDGPAAEFIETAYRRFRKYGASAITVTQGINDFYKTAATRACLDNSDWMFLLRQRQESLTALKEKKQLILPDHVFDMLSTIHTISGQYSEVFINCSKGPAFGRLFIDDFSYWIYTTNPQERALLNAFKENGLPLDETVEACIATKVLLIESLKRGRTPHEAVQLCVGDYMDKKKKYSDRQAQERELANV